MRIVLLEDLNRVQRLALKAAELVMHRSYSPYSRFRVGAALAGPTGSAVAGTNFENASFGQTICAERVAITMANALGRRNFTTIAIIASGEAKPVTKVTPPCGSCRHVIYEFGQLCDVDIEVIGATTDKGQIKIWKISELFPDPFGPADLGVDITRFKAA